MLPICFTHGLALLSHYFKSITCVYSMMFSLQRCCMGVLCCYFRPKMFSPGDCVQYHSRTLGAHVWATVVGPSPNGPQFCHIRYIHPGGVTPVDHESAQRSRLDRGCGGTTVCLEIPLQSPPSPPPPPGDRHLATVSPPPPPGRPSRANVGDCKGSGGYHAPLVSKPVPSPYSPSDPLQTTELPPASTAMPGHCGSKSL